MITGHLHLTTMQVPGAEVRVYRVKDPVRGDDPQYFEDGVLDAEPITEQVCMVKLSHTVQQKPLAPFASAQPLFCPSSHIV